MKLFYDQAAAARGTVVAPEKSMRKSESDRGLGRMEEDMEIDEFDDE